jgi:NAD(P)-dependent dehydrogenase (short-subunit alcohol dehydrogenase family)
MGARYSGVTIVANTACMNAEASSLGDIGMVQMEMAIN